MKKRLLIFNLMLFIFYSSFSQNMGIGTATPDSSAALDIVHSAKGLLVPRMTTTGMLGIPRPAHGLIVFDSLANQVMVNVGTPTTPNWQTALSTFTGWTLKGNAGINPANTFVGTTDNQPLRFRINNIQTGELNPSNGSILWGLRSGQSITSGSNNIAVGTDALNLNSTVNSLVAIGDSALFHNGQNSATITDGTKNVAIGSKSLFSSTTGSSN